MNVVGPLFAAGADWLDFVLPILVAIFWIVGQILNLVRRPAGAGGRPAAPPPRPPRRPVAGEPPADVRVQLERQIEEFLRQSRGGPQQPAPAPRPTPPPLPAAPRTDRSQGGGKKAAKPPTRAAAKAAKPAPRLTDRQFAPLGDAGDDVVEHVQEAFANDLGHRDPMLAPPPAAKPAGAAAVTADFATAVRDPAALRRLIVMREILDRPVERWE
jgi:hypothetical protein